MEKKWSKWRFEKGENEGLSAVSSHDFSRISKYKMGTAMKILDRGMRPSRSLQEPTIFSDKLCSLEAQKVLATFWYNKFYRWLTVAPLGDDAFLKASRTSDLHFLGGWSVASSIGLISFTWMIFFCSGNSNSHGKQWIFYQQAFYLPNPTNLTFFLHL